MIREKLLSAPSFFYPGSLLTLPRPSRPPLSSFPPFLVRLVPRAIHQDQASGTFISLLNTLFSHLFLAWFRARILPWLAPELLGYVRVVSGSWRRMLEAALRHARYSIFARIFRESNFKEGKLCSLLCRAGYTRVADKVEDLRYRKISL